MNFTVIIAVFILYLLGMLAVGFAFYKKTDSLSDYILGGRQLNKWVTSLSAQASDMSSWLLMGLPGLAFTAGLGEPFWVALGLAIGTWLNWYFVAKRLRIYTQEAENSLTISDYLENRFKEMHNVLRSVSAVFILVFFLVYTVSGFVAGGKLFNSVFGLDYSTSVIVIALVVVSYTFMGGFKAVCWTDFIQGSLMFIAVVIVPLAAFIMLAASGKTPEPVSLSLFTDGSGSSLTAIVIISSMAWGLGYFGMPHVLVRFMAIKNPDEMRDARRIATVWVVIALAAAVIIGIVGSQYFSVFPMPENFGPEKVFIELVSRTFPVLIGAVFLSAILAAIMSTADSQLLVTASAISEDIYKSLIRKDASQKELVWISRGTVITVAIIALIFAFNEGSSVLAIVAFGWAGLGATFGPSIIVSLYWRRMTARAALSGMICGGLTTIIWKNLNGGLFSMYEIVPGFAVSFLVILVVSLLDKKPSDQVLKQFDSVSAQVGKM